MVILQSLCDLWLYCSLFDRWLVRRLEISGCECICYDSVLNRVIVSVMRTVCYTSKSNLCDLIGEFNLGPPHSPDSSVCPVSPPYPEVTEGFA